MTTGRRRDATSRHFAAENNCRLYPRLHKLFRRGARTRRGSALRAPTVLRVAQFYARARTHTLYTHTPHRRRRLHARPRLRHLEQESGCAGAKVARLATHSHTRARARL